MKSALTILATLLFTPLAAVSSAADLPRSAAQPGLSLPNVATVGSSKVWVYSQPGNLEPSDKTALPSNKNLN